MTTQKRYYKFKLRKPNKGKGKLMEEAIDKFKSSVNYWLELIDEMGEYPNRGNTHEFGYRKAREEFPDLYSETVQEAMNRAIQIYRANGLSKYKEDSMSFRKRFVEIESHFIKLPLLKEKKIWLPFVIPPKFKKIFEFDCGNIVLKKKDDEWYIYISFKIPIEKPYQPRGWFGLDLGINNIAVLSDPEGKVNRFFNGKYLRRIREGYFLKRKHIQSQKSRENNKSRVLKTLSDKEKSYTSYINHCISKEVVLLAKEYGYGIALEKLKGIRKNKKGKTHNRRLSSWKFHDLKEKIKYKAEYHGVPFKLINPKNTSKRCSKCGEINKVKGKEFLCSNCGLKINRDLNGARNIASVPPLP